MIFDKPTILTLTGPSGSGKTFLQQRLVESGLASKIITTTSRPPRSGEVDGVDYHFMDKQRALELHADKKFVEYNEFQGNSYGVTSFDFVSKMMGEKIPTIVVDINGVENYQHICNEMHFNIMKVFIHAPLNTLKQRVGARFAAELNAAGDDIPGVVFDRMYAVHETRLRNLPTESGWVINQRWDAIVPGDDIDKAIEMINQAITWKKKRNEVPVPYTHHS